MQLVSEQYSIDNVLARSQFFSESTKSTKFKLKRAEVLWTEITSQPLDGRSPSFDSVVAEACRQDLILLIVGDLSNFATVRVLK